MVRFGRNDATDLVCHLTVSRPVERLHKSYMAGTGSDVPNICSLDIILALRE